MQNLERADLRVGEPVPHRDDEIRVAVLVEIAHRERSLATPPPRNQSPSTARTPSVSSSSKRLSSGTGVGSIHETSDVNPVGALSAVPGPRPRSARHAGLLRQDDRATAATIPSPAAGSRPTPPPIPQAPAATTTKTARPAQCSPRRPSQPCAANTPNVAVNNPGPIIPVTPRNEPSAPWSRPCSVGFTRRDMIACVGGLASPHIEANGTASQNIHGAVARPYNANPSRAADRTRQDRAAFTDPDDDRFDEHRLHQRRTNPRAAQQSRPTVWVSSWKRLSA